MQKESRLIDFASAVKQGRLLLSAAAIFFFAFTALAQAWLAPKGEASFGLTYSNLYTNEHLFSEGERTRGSSIRMNIAVAGVTYSFTDRLAGTASIPFVASRYEGSAPHALPVDDGSYHGRFTDFGLGLRYNLLREPAMVTPFISASVPISDYPYFGHASLGSGLRQYAVGVNVGRRLDPILDAGFAHVRYSYGWAEKVRDIRQDRSNLNLELGYFLTSAIGVSVLGSYQHSYGGLELPLPGTQAARDFRNSPYFVHHDHAARSDYFNVGGSVDYALNGSVDLFASYQKTVWGRNIHAIDTGLSFGARWGFSPKRVIRSFARKSATSESSPE